MNNNIGSQETNAHWNVYCWVRVWIMHLHRVLSDNGRVRRIVNVSSLIYVRACEFYVWYTCSVNRLTLSADATSQVPRTWICNIAKRETICWLTRGYYCVQNGHFQGKGSIQRVYTQKRGVNMWYRSRFIGVCAIFKL